MSKAIHYSIYYDTQLNNNEKKELITDPLVVYYINKKKNTDKDDESQNKIQVSTKFSVTEGSTNLMMAIREFSLHPTDSEEDKNKKTLVTLIRIKTIFEREIKPAQTELKGEEKNDSFRSKEKPLVTSAQKNKLKSKNASGNIYIIEPSKTLINHQDAYGDTALMLAAARIKQTPEIIKKLLEHELTDVNIQDRFGRTALHTAIYNENFITINELLNHPKINLHIQDNSGKSSDNLLKDLLDKPFLHNLDDSSWEKLAKTYNDRCDKSKTYSVRREVLNTKQQSHKLQRIS